VDGSAVLAARNATILVSNYCSIPHQVPAVFAQLDALLRGFDQALRFWLSQIAVPTGSRLAIVDLYTPSLGRQGLVTVERRLGFTGWGPFDFGAPRPSGNRYFLTNAHDFGCGLAEVQQGRKWGLVGHPGTALRAHCQPLDCRGRLPNA
jgi:hypothetical protein